MSLLLLLLEPVLVFLMGVSLRAISNQFDEGIYLKWWGFPLEYTLWVTTVIFFTIVMLFVVFIATNGVSL